MNSRILTVGVLALLLASVNSCKKTDVSVNDNTGISQEVLGKILALGFDPDGAVATDGGYVVENDIFLTKEDLEKGHADIHDMLVFGNEEQYRTTNLVTGLPRNIKVYMNTQLPASYAASIDEAIARYNAQGLQVTFTRVTSNVTGAIQIKKAPNNASYLASAGFPTSAGNPYTTVLVNSAYLGSNPGLNYLATIIAHEMGHCIGFRHTDYMDRSYSCGGSYYNEGSAGVGAILIPGTPSTADPNPWMLACIAAGQNRPFNANDVTALNYLY